MKAHGPVSLFGVGYETCLCNAMDLSVDFFFSQVSRLRISAGNVLLFKTIHGQSVGKIRVNPLSPMSKFTSRV